MMVFNSTTLDRLFSRFASEPQTHVECLLGIFLKMHILGK